MRQPAQASRRPMAATDVQRAFLRLQRGVQRQLQAEVRAQVGTQSPALERYYRNYLRDLRRGYRASTYGELHTALLESDIVLIGDYHTLRQSQENARRLLERAALDARPVCLGLEMVLEDHQPHLDAYMRGDLDDDAFLEAIRYRENWNFRWWNFRPLLDTARAAGVRVVAVNAAERSAPARDARMANRILEIRRAMPDARLLVLVGDMHLAAKHLPAALDREAERLGVPAGKQLLVYQNSDDLYWDLAARGAETTTQVVRMGADRFCVVEVPPWVKLQSYLGWEQELESSEGASEGPEATCGAVVEHLVRRLSELLGLPLVDPTCEAFANFEEAFFDAVDAADLPEERAREIHLHAFANRGCFVPELGLAYLPYLSVHHAAEEAMHIVHHRTSGFHPVSGERFEDFYARILWVALGHAASKMVNPLRTASDEEAFRSFLRATTRKLHEPELAFRKLVARFVLQHKDHERARRRGGRGRLQQIYAQDLDITLEIVQALGGILGERMFAALRDGRIEREALAALVRAPRGEPSRTYFAWIDSLETN